MRSALRAGLGLVLGVAAAYGAALLWNPDSYEAALPLLLAGAVGGPVAAVMLGGGGRAPAPRGSRLR